MLKNVFFLILILFCIQSFSQNNLDSVKKYIYISKKIYNPEEKINYLEKARSFALKTDNDSLIIKTFSEIAFQSILLEDKEKFEASNETLKGIYQAKKYALPLGLYYQNKGFYFYNNASLDSAYYYFEKAETQYKKAKNKNQLIQIYLNLLDINYVSNDYLAIEDLAIEIFNNEKFTKEYKFLAYTNSYLGLVASGLHDYESSLEFHKISLELIKNIKDDKTRTIEEAALINNLGLMHLDFDKFEEALVYFNEALKKTPNLKTDNLVLFATIIANIGICEIKTGKRENGLKNLQESLVIGEEIKDLNIQIVSLLEFARFYYSEKDLVNAADYIDKTMVLSEKNGFKKVDALLLSAEIYTGEKAIAFYQKYVEVKKIEEENRQRAKRKFVRFKYEAQKKEEENSYLKQQNELTISVLNGEKQKNKIIILIAIIGFFTAFLIYVFYLTKKRTFTYKTNLEKARAREEERREIATTLHDKVVGDLWVIYQRALKIKEPSITKPLSKVNSEIRNLSHELCSVSFNEVSFKDQLINLISDYFSPTFNVKVNGLEEIDWDLIKPEIKRALYLVIRESIQNSKKHAFASKVFIGFKRKQNNIELNVTDNGKGFELSTLKYGLGLLNQKKRVLELNGTYDLKGETNAGIITSIKIPLGV
jgi:signal transduction histidine kinase